MTWVEIIAQYLIPLILAVITYQLIPVIRDKRAYSIAVWACAAAEQLWKSGAIQNSDRYKKAHDMIKKKLKLSDEEIQMLIEAVVGGGEHIV